MAAINCEFKKVYQTKPPPHSHSFVHTDTPRHTHPYFWVGGRDTKNGRNEEIDVPFFLLFLLLLLPPPLLFLLPSSLSLSVHTLAPSIVSFFPSFLAFALTLTLTSRSFHSQAPSKSARLTPISSSTQGIIFSFSVPRPLLYSFFSLTPSFFPHQSLFSFLIPILISNHNVGTRNHHRPCRPYHRDHYHFILGHPYNNGTHTHHQPSNCRPTDCRPTHSNRPANPVNIQQNTTTK